MKLHLNKTLRTALLCCVCGSVALTCKASADNVQLPDDYNLEAGISYDLGYEGNTAEGQDLTLSSGDGTHGLYVGAETTITANKVSGSGQSITKEGDGTLIISGSDARPEDVIVNAGVLQMGYGNNGTGFATGDVTVNGGGTLKLMLKDSLGWNGGWQAGNFTDTLTLEGSTTGEGDDVVVNTATLEVNNSQTLSTVINLKGYSTITGGSFIAWNENKITATNTNNTISSALKTCKDLNIEVTGVDDTLLISGVIGFTDNNSTNNDTHDLIKSGAGTLTISNAVESGSDLIINGGKVILAAGSSVHRNNEITINSGGTLQLDAGSVLDTAENKSPKAINLEGSSDAVATLTENAINAFTGTLNLKGNTLVNGSAYLKGQKGASPTEGDPYATINVTGTNNTISITLAAVNKITLNVEEEASLDLTGNNGKLDNYSQGDGHGQFDKTGTGTLTLSNGAHINGGATLNVLEGTAVINTGNAQNSGIRGYVTVSAGATLQLLANDALGYKNGAAKGITLTGEENNVATLQVDNHQTMTTNITLNGNTLIKSENTNGNLEGFGGGITATGKNNTISATLKTRKDLTLNVAGANDELTVEGSVVRGTSSEATNYDLIKTGAGKLTLTLNASVASNVDVIVDGGTLRQEGNKDISYVLRGGTLELTDNRIGSVGNTNKGTPNNSTGSITLEAESDGTTSENTIRSDNKAGAVFVNITGEGNLTIENNLNVYSSMDFTGKLTLASGHTNIGYQNYAVSATIANNGDIVIAEGATATVDAQANNDATVIANTGKLTVNGSLKVAKGTVSSGGGISVDGENATLQLGAAATINSSVTVTNGGTIDLTNVTTLKSSGLDLAAGTIVKLGQNPVELTGTLAIAEGALIDLSAWCSKASFEAFMPIFTLSGDGQFSPTLDGVKVTIKLSDAPSAGGWLELSDDGRTVMLVPEPTTATLSLLALAALAARRRRK